LNRGKGAKLRDGSEARTLSQQPEIAQVDGLGYVLAEANSKLPAGRILDILRDSPSGLTAKEVADRLGATAPHIGSRLSKLAAYGVISKRRERIASDVYPCALYSFPILPSTPPLPLQNDSVTGQASHGVVRSIA
jgi:DNA-binding transcriptional ArsR family regulator